MCVCIQMFGLCVWIFSCAPISQSSQSSPLYLVVPQSCAFEKVRDGKVRCYRGCRGCSAIVPLPLVYMLCGVVVHMFGPKEAITAFYHFSHLYLMVKVVNIRRPLGCVYCAINANLLSILSRFGASVTPVNHSNH